MGLGKDDHENANVARFLGQMAELQPRGCAVRAPLGNAANGVIRYDSRSFRELSDSANRVAGVLKRAGIDRGTRTLLMVRPGLPLIEVCFAIFKLGAVPVVIDPGMGLGGFLRCVRQTEPAALVGIPLAIGLSRVFRGTFATVRTRVTVGGSWTDRIGREASSSHILARTPADELAAILFTSGSTGPAKGVQYTHGMFDAQVRLIRDAYQIEPGEVDLPMLPIFALFNPALGMTTVVPQMNPSRPASVNPGRIVQAIEQNLVTNSFGSPVLWDRIVGYCERRAKTLPSLKRVLMAGAPAPFSLLKRLKTLMSAGEVHTPYGATECLPVATISASEVLEQTWARTQSGAGTCVGRAVPSVSIRIIEQTEEAVGAEVFDRCLKVGEIGEIVVTGPSVTRVYDHRPDATWRSKIEAGDGRVWHRMGDVGYLDEHRRLWFCGRAVERVQTAQGTLFTDRVEAIFNQLDGVRRCALIGLGEPPAQMPAIVVEARKGARVTTETVIRHGAQFALTADITRVFFAKRFPVDVRHNAKIHRLALKRRFDREDRQ